MRTAKLVDAAARGLIGSTFLVLGYEAWRTPGARVGQAAPSLTALRRVLPIPADDELVVRANGAAQAVGGALLAAGVAPRLAAAGVAASLVPTTAAGHAFWTLADPSARKAQRVQFQKNLAMLGGLLLVVLRPRRGDGPSRA